MLLLVIALWVLLSIPCAVLVGKALQLGES